jgi:RHS repeat-associated protein
VSTQEYTPWGAVRSGGIGQTTLNYTGQRRDGTGLLFYGARYYDPGLARFVSADSIVPGAASGKGGVIALGYDDKAALRLLTVDFHELGFATGVNAENSFTLQKGFWFQLGDEDRKEAKYQWGPANPQGLNRYSYVLNNPLRYTDPTGHSVYLSHEDAGIFAQLLVKMADIATAQQEGWKDQLEFLISVTARSLAINPAIGGMLAAAATFLKVQGWKGIAKLRELASRITDMNGADGVAIGGMRNNGSPFSSSTFSLWVLNRETGDMREVKFGYITYLGMIPLSWDIDVAFGDNPRNGRYWFTADTDGKTGAIRGCPRKASSC